MKAPRSLGHSISMERLQRVIEQDAKVLSNISFGTTLSNGDDDMNMQVHKASGTSPGTINVEFAVTHTLKHVPIGFMVVSTNKAAHFYKSTTAWTAATNSSLGSIYLKCDVITVAFVIVIL